MRPDPKADSQGLDPGWQGRRPGNQGGLTASVASPWIKVCGIRRTEDAICCREAGVDAVGLNLFPKSPRFINEQDLSLLGQGWPAGLDAVALFVSPNPSEMAELVGRHPWIGFIQIHGLDQPPLDPPPRPWILAGSAHPKEGFQPLRSLLQMCMESGTGPSAVLLDGYKVGMHGGTGVKAPWSLINPKDWPISLILAGGINPANVREAMATVGPWGIDVASGVESSTGIKDPGLIKELVSLARQGT